MALVVKNNISGLYTLNQLNKNSSALAKSLQKVSSGMQINGAGDNASAYSISEKMRARIRGLDQCNMNTVTGRNMIEVASGAVGEQLDILKKLREIALKSSDDTYAQVDRDVLQSETNHLLMELNNISYDTNYNGQQLLNGSMGFSETVVTSGVPYQVFDPLGELNPNTKDVIVANDADQYPNSTPVSFCPGSAGSSAAALRASGERAYAPTTYAYLRGTFYDPNTTVPAYNLMPNNDVAALSVGDTVYDSQGTQYTVTSVPDQTGATSILAATDGTNTYVIVNARGEGIDANGGTTVSSNDFPAGMTKLRPCSLGSQYAVKTSFQVGDTVTQSSAIGSPIFTVEQEPFSNELIIYETGANSVYELDFPGLSAASLPNDLDGQGMSILCDGCEQFVSIKFDVSQPSGSAQYWQEEGGEPWHRKSEAYSIGVSDVTSPNDLAKALFDGIQSLNGSYGGNSNRTLVSSAHTVTIAKSGDSYYLTKVDLRLALWNGFKGTISTIQPKQDIQASYRKPYQNFRIQGETKATMFTNLRFPNTTLNVLFPPEDSDFDLDPRESDYPNPWPQEYLSMSDKEKERYGEKYNCVGDEEQIRREKWRDEVWPYPRKGAVASGSCVRTREKAKKFLDDIDQAIKYVLEVSTTFGAQSQRMTMMNSNIVTGTENTQSSESVIRDADMAKEMESYTKNNVLVQSAQSMLSQSNQNTSGVLSLLE